MRAAVPPPLRLLHRSAPARDGSARAKGLLLPTIAALVVVTVLFALASALSSERRALRALPPEERVSLVARTVVELRRSCGDDRAEALRGHCRELASFAAQFEECRGECETLVHRQLTPIPTR